MTLNTTTCRAGVPLREMLTAREAFIIKNFLNKLTVRQWNKPYTEVDRSNPDGEWVIFIPHSTGGGGAYNGEAYTPAGHHYEDLNDIEKPWLKYDLSTGVITEEIGPPSHPWGANESWRKKSDLSGAAYF